MSSLLRPRNAGAAASNFVPTNSHALPNAPIARAHGSPNRSFQWWRRRRMRHNFNAMRFRTLTFAISLAATIQANAAESPASESSLRAGTNFVATRVYSADDDAQVLKAFAGLRVADVSDGMDAVGLHNTGLVSSEIAPLWKDTKEFTH